MIQILRKLLRRNFLFCLLVVVTAIDTVNAQNSKFAAQLTTGIQDNFTSFTPQKLYKDRTKLLMLTPAKYAANPDFGKSFIGKHYEDSAQWCELINKRTLKSRTYVDINDTGHILIQYGYDNLNYVDGNGWLRAVDLKLKPFANGWSAAQQEIPVYLYPDGSTALSLGHGQVMNFNKNVKFNNSTISTADHTVGDNGMYIKNAAPNTDKIIRFRRSTIETDYRINKPMKLTGDLIISEDIILPASYTISEKTNYDADIEHPGCLVVKDASGKMAAELKAPLCYDSNKGSIIGAYHIQQQPSGYRLEVDVPSSWLNDSLRRYPVTIDPLVIGPITIWTGGIFNSCLNSLGTDTGGMDTASILIIIPPKITLSNFYVQSNYFAALTDVDSATMWFTTNCIDSIYTDFPFGGANYFPGWGVLSTDFIQDVVLTELNCYPPSCSQQSFRLMYALVRMAGGSGCNTTYVYYDPTYFIPFEAYVEGNTVVTNTAGAGWTVSPNPTCGNDCTLKLSSTTINGVPPYTITHPWAVGSTIYGKYDEATAISTGVINLNLTIPGCPEPVCNSSSITVPPPVIIDACGDTVQGLTSIVVTFNPVPDVMITPSSATICSDSSINGSLSTCVAGSTLAWKGSDGSSGLNEIVDAPVNNGALPDTVTYMVTATSAAGCISSPAQMKVVVNPLPDISISPSSPSICAGGSIGLAASGALTYTWNPSVGLSATTGDSVMANSPGSTYTVIGKSVYGCMGKTSVTVGLAPPPVISVSPPASTVCIGANTTLTAQGGSSYTWKPAAGLNATDDSSVTVTPTITTTYTVTGTNSLGCTDSTTVVVTSASLPQVSFFMTVPSNCDPQQVQFADTISGGVNYLWNFGDGSSGVSPNPFHTYIISGSYSVKLTVTDLQGCTDTASANESIISVGYVAVPNAFTPVGDGSDSYFTPHVLCTDYSDYVFGVYNRWGQLIFQTNDTGQGWDGRYNGATEPIGVYIYYVKFNCGNCALIKKGNITLLK